MAINDLFKMLKTKPLPRFPEGHKPDPNNLTAKRYGTLETVEAFGAEQLMADILLVQGISAEVLSARHPDVIPLEAAREIAFKANLDHVSPKRIREIEAKTGHDVIGINSALEEVVDPSAAPHIHKPKTSADATQPARAIQLKRGVEIIAHSTENLRDIVIERAEAWINVPHMDQSHFYDALPTVAGRPFAHYAEMLDSGLQILKVVYEKSIMGKWADASGNHHGATSLKIDGPELEKDLCDILAVNSMIAPAQLPGLEFETDVVYALTRISATVGNLATYIRRHKGSDAALFLDSNPKRRKGSSAMPHKDLYGGNPTTEEQDNSWFNHMAGTLTTAMMNTQMDYARDLSASANMRVALETAFKVLDHGIRRLASTVYWLNIDEDRARERIDRTFGVTTSNQVLYHLTDPRMVKEPLGRKEAHHLLAKLATQAYTEQRQFGDVLLEDSTTAVLGELKIRELTDPYTFIGESQRLIRDVKEKHYQKITIEG
ncbi:hypothetical protein HOI26_01935 [Candidatus Woesearchaeota archaeon]|nr:hypothetical protein [Candidatus Woesearchaeota archaeon]